LREASFRVGSLGSGAGATGSTSSSALVTGKRSVEGSGESPFAMVIIISCGDDATSKAYAMKAVYLWG
jgi:hypothetical protein